MKLNFGSGESNLEGFINVDLCVDPKNLVKPDIICDIRKEFLPFNKESFTEVWMIHSLEHIERKFWSKVFDEFFRVLEPNGRLNLAYPEFERCAHNFVTNYKGARDYWRNTLYGRQLQPGDYHVVPMRTEEVKTYLRIFGFHDIRTCPEDEEDWNTFVTCIKGTQMKTREDLLRKEVFNLKET